MCKISNNQEGSLNVFHGCCIISGRPLASNVVVDETWFSDPLVCKEMKAWYFLSKFLEEEAAWKFAKENGIDMVTINPPYVMGPLLQPTLNFSVKMVLELENDVDEVTRANYLSTDVRDVASAHVLAFEVPSASGRYCLVANSTPLLKALKILKKLRPPLCPQEICEDDIPSIPEYQVSPEKSKNLGLSFLPLEASLTDTIECLKEKGFLKA